MNRKLLLALFLVCLAVPCAMAQADDDRPNPPSPPGAHKDPIDVLSSAAPASPLPDPTALRTRPVRRHEKFGVPSFLWATPPESGQASPPTTDPVEAARGHLSRVGHAYGLQPADLQNAIAEVVHDNGAGPLIVRFHQQIAGIDVFRESASVLLDRALKPVAVGGFLSPLPEGSDVPAFVLGAQEAASLALGDLRDAVIDANELVALEGPAPGGYVEFSGSEALAARGITLGRPMRAKPTWFHVPGAYVPAYMVEVEATIANTAFNDMYSYVISAVDGAILLRKDLTSFGGFTYRVWADPAPPFRPWDGPQGPAMSPHPTGFPDPLVAPMAGQNLVTLSSGPISTGDPWLPEGATQLNGNNAWVFADVTGSFGYDPGDVLGVPSYGNAFDWTYDDRASFASPGNRQAALAHAFYVFNYLHDVFYDAGFREADGNAQFDNYGRGGVGNDPWIVHAQYWGNWNYNWVSIPWADGGSPRVVLYPFTHPGARVRIDAPASIAGDRTAGYMTFGRQGWGDFAGEVGVVSTGTWLACSPLSPAEAALVAGKIALVDRGTCVFKDKAKNAQDAGAIGMLIANSQPGLMDGADYASGVTIPILMLPQTDGAAIKSAVAAGERVYVTMTRFAQDVNDSALDTSHMAHEWGHLLTSRSVFYNTYHAMQLAEGWSDFIALLMTVRPEDAATGLSGAYPFGPFVVSGGSYDGDLANTAYYHGQRRLPYSTDVAINPLTYKHMIRGVALPEGYPYSFRQGTDNFQFHNAGEIWANMLWECYASLLRELPFEEALSRMRQYLVAAYKVTPDSPTLLEARDALLAVTEASDHADFLRFVKAFAKRGAGYRAEAPTRYTFDNVGIVESFDVGGDVTLVSASLADDLRSCDRDGLLDAGEHGKLRVTVRNVGTIDLDETKATVYCDTPAVSYPNGVTLDFGPSSPGDVLTASIPLKLDRRMVGLKAVPCTITFAKTPVIVTPELDVVTFYANGDQVPNRSASDDVESGHTVWTTANAGAYQVFARELQDKGFNHVWHGAVMPFVSDGYLVSPPLPVATDGEFSFTFRHRFEFFGSISAAYYREGGVIELSTDGGATWTDIGAAASPGYNGVVSMLSEASIRGQQAFLGRNPSWPAYDTVTVNLGTAYQGRTVRVRFRLSTDIVYTDPGWDIDDIAFSGITNKPFDALVADPGHCPGK